MDALLSILLRISLLLFCTNAIADGVAGLNYKAMYAGGATPTRTESGRTVFSSGVSSQINYNWGSGSVFGGPSDGVIVHWTGYLKTPGTSGNIGIYFYNSSDDGFSLALNGSYVLNNWREQGQAYYNSNAGVTLAAGTVYAVDIWYYENGGGAVAQLYWNTGSGITLIPSSNFATSSSYWAPQYSSGITNAQQTRKNSETSQRTSQSGNGIYIDQIGNYNNVTIRQGGTSVGKDRLELYLYGDSNTLNLNQGYNTNGTVSANDSNNHYQYLNLTGNSNSVTTKQTGDGHFMENTVSGNNNTLNFTQTDSGPKTMFTNTNGNSNSITATQSGTGTHYLDINLTGNGHSVTTSQSGTGNHAATIDLTNSGGAATLNLNQSGSTGQVYSIQQSCTNTAGCSTTITQP